MWNYSRLKRIQAWALVAVVLAGVLGGLLLQMGPGLRNQAWVHTKLILIQERAAELGGIEKGVVILVLGLASFYGLPAFPFIFLLAPILGPGKTFIGFFLMEIITGLSMKYFGEEQIARDTSIDAGIWERIGKHPALTGEGVFLSRLHIRLPQRFVDCFLLSKGWENPPSGWVFTATAAGQAVRVGLQVVWAWSAWNLWRGFQPFPEVDIALFAIVSVVLMGLFLWGFVPELVIGGMGLESYMRYLNDLPEPPVEVSSAEEAPVTGEHPEAIDGQPTEPKAA